MSDAGRETVVIPLQTLRGFHGEQKDDTVRTQLFEYCKKHIPGTLTSARPEDDLVRMIKVLKFVLNKMRDLKISITFATGEPPESMQYIVYYAVVDYYAPNLRKHASKRAFQDPQTKALLFLDLIQAIFDVRIKKGIWTLKRNQ
jgi:hypothetical protein